MYKNLNNKFYNSSQYLSYRKLFIQSIINGIILISGIAVLYLITVMFGVNTSEIKEIFIYLGLFSFIFIVIILIYATLGLMGTFNKDSNKV